MAETLPPWLKPAADGCILALHIQPGAKRSEIAGEHGAALKIRLSSPPLEGRANEALIVFLAKKLDIPRAQLTLLSGDHSRQKRVAVSGIGAEAVWSCLVA